MRTSRGALVVLAVTALALVGCGKDEPNSAPDADAASTGSTTSPTSSPRAGEGTPEPAVEYAVLSEKDLSAALLDVTDVPVGYSPDPSDPDTSNKTFCDYEPPYTERARVRQDFIKGGGLSAEIVSATLRQFTTPEQAQAAFDALADTVGTCKSETYQGDEMAYSQMAAPKVGEASVGVRIETDQYTLVQNFVLVGPVILSVGGGGLMNVDADPIAELVSTQVDKYEQAAHR